jgi:hypothetical protein
MQRNHAPESGSESRVPHSILTTDPSASTSPIERHELELESRLGRLRGLGGDVSPAPAAAARSAPEVPTWHGRSVEVWGSREGEEIPMGAWPSETRARVVGGRLVDVECWPLAGIRWHHGDVDDFGDGEFDLRIPPQLVAASRADAEVKALDRYGSENGRVGQMVPGSTPHSYRFRVFRIGADQPEPGFRFDWWLAARRNLARAAAPDQHLDPAAPVAGDRLGGEDDDVTAALSADVERLRSDLADLQERTGAAGNRVHRIWMERLPSRVDQLELQVHRLRLALRLVMVANTLLVVAIGLAFVWGGGAA